MTSGINTREMILEILLQINEEGEHSHIAIRNYHFLQAYTAMHKIHATAAHLNPDTFSWSKSFKFCIPIQ